MHYLCIGNQNVAFIVVSALLSFIGSTDIKYVYWHKILCLFNNDFWVFLSLFLSFLWIYILVATNLQLILNQCFVLVKSLDILAAFRSFESSTCHDVYTTLFRNERNSHLSWCSYETGALQTQNSLLCLSSLISFFTMNK